MTQVLERAVDSDRSLASVVKRMGGPVSTILLDSPSSVFHQEGIDGAIGYIVVNRCAVVIGDPLCSQKSWHPLVGAFQSYCAKMGLSILYLLASDEFAKWATDHGCQTSIKVGEELLLDTVEFKMKQKLRWKVNQAVQQGVTFSECTVPSGDFVNRVKMTVQEWLSTRRGPQIHLGSCDFFASPYNRTFFAKWNGKMVGLLALSPVDLNKGWVVTTYLALDESPVGTTELLITSVIEALAKEECRSLCLGAVGGEKVGEMVGLSRFSTWMVRLLFQFSEWAFNLDAKRIYLHKYHPKASPKYLLANSSLGWSQLMAIKKVLNVKL